ncbi:MAG: hypothetical protein PSV17_05530 [Methylotenera sp.]|uniref:hypothetical protein n=1 Tax=Methylotenera sp. TaxID=2051956 RepID=UPI002488C33D|nr:hypothetical protein [Methylotenera sp.]MDI1308878.1 hypothetical protein [Methylotenera sp.]
MNKKFLLVLMCLVAFGAYQHYQHRPVVHGVGEIASAEPIQTSTGTADIQFKGFTLTPLADYSIKARVLSTEDYSMGTEAELSPTDLALGWGPMSDEAVLNKIKITQGNRFFYWHVDEFPIPQREIEIHAANTHIIPANDSIKRQLSKIRPGQVVSIKGQLIEAKRADGWHWRSSLTREDTGAGACEVVYVTELSVS